MRVEVGCPSEGQSQCVRSGLGKDDDVTNEDEMTGGRTLWTVLFRTTVFILESSNLLQSAFLSLQFNFHLSRPFLLLCSPRGRPGEPSYESEDF